MSIFGDVISKWMGAQPAPKQEFRRKGNPEPGDIVYLRLPNPDNPNRPGPHARYGVVVRTQANPGAHGGETTLLVVPADFSGSKPARSCEFDLDQRGAAAAGLPRPASFDLRKSVITGWSAKWSEPGRYPIVGQLDEPAFERFRVSYRSWLELQKQAAEKARPVRPTPAPAPFNLEIAKLKRNRGKVIEQWI